MVRPTTIVLPIALMAFAIVAWLVLVDFSLSTQQQSNSKVNIHQACTDEAKICSDGSAVGRTGPNCAFAACPAVTNTNQLQRVGNVNFDLPDDTNTSEIACATDVQTCNDGSFVQRVPPTCEFAACPAGSEPIAPGL